jgi:hypothetical protein
MTNVFIIIMIFLLLFIAIIFIRKFYGNDNLVAVKSQVDGQTYYVRQASDKFEASNTLGMIHQNMMKLVDYLQSNKAQFPENLESIKDLVMRIKDVEITETPDDDKYTSYTVNKGEKMVFCIRSKIFNQIHDMNTIMYVAIHEMAHVACPEYGHTQKFKEIFTFLLQQSAKIGIYTPIDYRKSPVNYCGMVINEYLLDTPQQKGNESDVQKINKQ